MRMRVVAATMETGLLIAQTAIWHCCLSIKRVDQSVVYLFDYLLSGLPLELDNQGGTVY